MAQPIQHFVAVEEYLWQEQRADVKHEFFNGQVYNMAGGSPEHSIIAVNLTSELRTLLRGKNCQVFNSDLKVAVAGQTRKKNQKRQPEDEFVTYPDATVVCGQLEFYKDDQQTAANPTVLFEVLSPSTRNYDRSTKLEYYRKIPSLQAYIMIDSERIWVEVYERTSANSWKVSEPLEDLTVSFSIASPNLNLSLSALYENIDFTEHSDA